MMDSVDKLRERVAELEAIARERQEHALALTQRVFDEARRRRDAEAQAESARAGESAALDLVDQLERGQEMLRDLLLAQHRCNEELRGELRRAPVGRYYGDVVIARNAADIARAEAECARAGEAAALEEAAFFRADVGRIEEILQLTEEDAGDEIESAMAGESAALEQLAAHDSERDADTEAIIRRETANAYQRGLAEGRERWQAAELRAERLAEEGAALWAENVGLWAENVELRNELGSLRAK